MIMNNKLINLERRKFLTTSVVLASASILSREPYAIAPLVGSIIQIIAKSIVRNVGRNTVRNSGRRWLISSSLVAEEVLALATEVAAEAIWAQNVHENLVHLSVENTTKYSIKNFPIKLLVIDNKNGTDELSLNAFINAKPLGKHSYSLFVKDLPYTGVKRIIGITPQDSNQEVKVRGSGNIVVASNNKFDI